MMQKIQQWKERFEALSLRERALASLTVLVVLYLGWDTALMSGLDKQQKKVHGQIKKWDQQIKDIDQRIQVVTVQLNATKQAEALQRIENLKLQIESVNQRQQALSISFIRPKQMLELLKGLLADEKGLKLTRLQSISAQPLFERQRDGNRQAKSEKQQRIQDRVKTKSATNSSETAAENKDDAASVANLPQIFKHGLEIEFQGDYLSTLSYLKKLETLPWKFYWDEVAYEVLEHPTAQITLKIHTLSLDKGWISV
ncbi:hypothetical protein [Kaarinaea lacus]